MDDSGVDGQKANLYQQILSYWCEPLRSEAGGKNCGADGRLHPLEQHLVLQGSRKVIAAYVNLRQATKQTGKPDDKFPGLLHQLVLEMRADLGRTALNLKADELLVLLQGCIE